MFRKFLIIASLSGFICVALGAFGAHSLKLALEPYQLTAFETGMRYQFYHTLALLAVAMLISVKGENVLLKYSGYFFTAGIIFFSGSLYFLSTQEILKANLMWLGPITPLGGLCFMIGWLLMVVYAVKSPLSPKGGTT